MIEERDLKYFEALSRELPGRITPLQKFEYLEYDLTNVEKKRLGKPVGKRG